MKIAAAQISCVVGDPIANLARIRELASRAKDGGAALVVFPEMSDTGYVMLVIREHASSWKTGAVPELQNIARMFSIAIICGVSEREGEFIFNSQVAIDETGAIIGKYRKTHLFSPAPIEEHTCFRAGDYISAVSLGHFRLGLSICYDLRFPEFYRALAIAEKTNVIVISSAWPFPRVEHLRVLATARAIENQSYVILANRVGTDNGVTFCGSSAIIDPSGVVLASASTNNEELVYAELSTDAIQSVRERMPVLTHRRTELYRTGEG